MKEYIRNNAWRYYMRRREGIPVKIYAVNSTICGAPRNRYSRLVNSMIIKKNMTDIRAFFPREISAVCHKGASNKAQLSIMMQATIVTNRLMRGASESGDIV
jgi:hypothetical protein